MYLYTNLYIYIYIYVYIYINLPVNVIVRPPHPRSGDRKVQETFSAPSVNRQTRNYDTECLNHHPSLRSKGLSYNKMKWWAKYTNLPVYVIVRLHHHQSKDSHGQETFLVVLSTMAKSAQTIIPPYQAQGQRDWAIARWNDEPCIQIYQSMP